MTNDSLRLLTGLWHVLSEVPGWPDAPRWMRVRRLLPALVPALGASALIGWNTAIREPARNTEQAAHAHLFALESDLADLRSRWSEQQASDLATRATEVGALLLDQPAAATPWLGALAEAARSRGWDASIQVYDLPDASTGAAGGIVFVSALARLQPTAPLAEPLRAILGLLEQFSSSGKRIDLTRMVVRADEPGRPSLEINLRVASRPPDEKTAQ
jgi:hypothetical protein